MCYFQAPFNYLKDTRKFEITPLEVYSNELKYEISLPELRFSTKFVGLSGSLKIDGILCNKGMKCFEESDRKWNSKLILQTRAIK